MLIAIIFLLFLIVSQSKIKEFFQYVLYLFISLYGYFLSIYYKDSIIIVTLLNFVLSKKLLPFESYDE